MKRLLAVALLLLPVAVSPSTTPPVSASFPGENGLIAFQGRTDQVSPDDLYLVSPNGGEPVNLTNSPNDWEMAPAWSPDGNRLAFTLDGNIWIINSDGTGLARLTEFNVADGLGAWDPAWSPDGTSIAYESKQEGGALMVLDVEMRATRRLADATDYAFSGGPSWSPDGSTIAFSTDAALWLVGADGANLRMLVPRGFYSNNAPSWAPDGRRIAYNGSVSEQEFGVMTVDVATQVTQLISDSGSPAWSPDGSRIATLPLHGPDSLSISTMAVDGSEVLEVVGSPYNVSSLDWQAVRPDTEVIDLPRGGGSPYQGTSRTWVPWITLGLATVFAAALWVAWQRWRTPPIR